MNLFILFVIFIITFAITVNTIVMGFINPEYGAIDQIVNLLK